MPMTFLEEDSNTKEDHSAFDPGDGTYCSQLFPAAYGNTSSELLAQRSQQVLGVLKMRLGLATYIEFTGACFVKSK